jgi:hypothetical protein
MFNLYKYDVTLVSLMNSRDLNSLFENIPKNVGDKNRKALVQRRKREQEVTSKLVKQSRVEYMTKKMAEIKIG